MRGFVRSYFIAKNFGFIRPEKGKDVFFHRSDIGDDTWNKIGGLFPSGNKVMVEYESKDSDKGPRATKVEIIS